MAESNTCEPICSLRVFVLLDSSGSMGGEVSPTKWEQAHEAMEELLATSAASSVEWGLGVFPSGGGDCDTSNQVVYPVPEATADLIDDYFVMNSPSGDTPLHEALTLMLEPGLGTGLGDPLYQDFILLVSDGSDTCYDEGCVDECGIFNPICIINCETRADNEVIEQLGVSAARLRDERQIRTFVIGFGSGVSDEELSAIAEQGGTVLGRWLPASNVSELVTRFDEILAEMLECNPIVY
jgi:Mg-chelatase subunit ChlD